MTNIFTQNYLYHRSLVVFYILFLALVGGFYVVACISYNWGYADGYAAGCAAVEVSAAADASEPTMWDSFVAALIDVESEGDPHAFNASSGAAGVLQITPIYVREVNRLLGEERYRLEDRYDRARSLEMFNIIQGHYNPDRDIDKALRLHNPGAGSWYARRVKNRMR